MTKRNLGVLIIEDRVDINDLENYIQYPEVQSALQNEKNWKSRGPIYRNSPEALNDFMNVVGKESGLAVSISHKPAYEDGIVELASSKDIIITDIGIPTQFSDGIVSYHRIDEDKANEARNEVVENFRKLFGKDWYTKGDGCYLKWHLLNEQDWLGKIQDRLDDFDKLDSPRTEDLYFFNREIAGLKLAENLEKQGKLVTMYTSDLIHQPGIYAGLLKGVISPQEFTELYQWHQGLRELYKTAPKEDFENFDAWQVERKAWEKENLGPVVINNGRIAIGARSTFKTVQDYVDVLNMAVRYQGKSEK